MNSTVSSRLIAHGLLGEPARDPVDVVRRLGAVQAQEFASALWAIGVRTSNATRSDIARALDEGRLVRTHVLRPTWHIVAPEDLRWMLALTRDRVHLCNRPGYLELELDPQTLRRCRRIIVSALTRSPLTRAEISAALATRGIEATGRRLAYLLMHEELEAVICNGPRRGKQFTYTLVEARVAPTSALTDKEAAPALLRRYLAGHGPATLHDFSWWSGLTVGDARRAAAALGAEIERHDAAAIVATSRTSRHPRPGVADMSRTSKTRTADGAAVGARRDGAEYLALANAAAPPRPRAPRAWLLPNFDEWFVGYRDRTLVAGQMPPLSALSSSVIVDGIRVGAWTSAAAAGRITVTLERSLSDDEQRAVARATAAASAFFGDSRSATESV